MPFETARIVLGLLYFTQKIMQVITADDAAVAARAQAFEPAGSKERLAGRFGFLAAGAEVQTRLESEGLADLLGAVQLPGIGRYGFRRLNPLVQASTKVDLISTWDLETGKNKLTHSLIYCLLHRRGPTGSPSPQVIRTVVEPTCAMRR